MFKIQFWSTFDRMWKDFPGDDVYGAAAANERVGALQTEWYPMYGKMMYRVVATVVPFYT